MALATVLLGILPAWGQDSSDSANAGAISIPRHGLFVPITGTGYQGIAATSVTAAAQVSGLPCFNCVVNVTGINAGLSMPVAVLSQSSPITITVLFDDTTYTGPCSVTYYFKQNKAVIQKGTYVYPSGCTANTYNGTYFNVTVPTRSGATALQAVVTAGTIKTAITQPLTIQ